ncbi:hypothetical protein BHT95_21135 [Bacillus paralicheniformis]|uniref:hypothetical protein n=1 Tax=Bacillus paralicheniformis TaxID=1648923 RepID=UPI0006829797|nr:hypothetical protein [Bacillus paralicheniformis]KND05469.1 hypothetical protein ACJ43_21530 [Bacillus paralicheniformis]OLQ51323.1 hypothetical protein BHT95_21135 [Bacillus paralicheniformis]WOH92253.1 hypothetical protein RZN08_05405 [Bacillus paralicheniformis]
MFELNLAHASILELLEKAAEKNELIFVRQGQRRLGKTTALLEFARKNNYPVLTKREVARCYQLEHPDLNIIGYVDGSEVDGLYNVVFDEGVPRDAVKRLYKLGILLTGFVHVDEKAAGFDPTETAQKSIELFNEKNKAPLLQIELEDIDSIPHVFYKGERITERIAIDFEWRTGDDKQPGSTYIRIKHGNDIDGRLVVETKELAIGARAYE